MADDKTVGQVVAGLVLGGVVLAGLISLDKFAGVDLTGEALALILGVAFANLVFQGLRALLRD